MKMIPFAFLGLMGILGAGLTGLMALLLEDSDSKSRPNSFKSINSEKRDWRKSEVKTLVPLNFDFNKSNEESASSIGKLNFLNFRNEEEKYKPLEQFFELKYERITVLEHYPTGEVKIRRYFNSSEEYY